MSGDGERSIVAFGPARQDRVAQAVVDLLIQRPRVVTVEHDDESGAAAARRFGDFGSIEIAEIGAFRESNGRYDFRGPGAIPTPSLAISIRRTDHARPPAANRSGHRSTQVPDSVYEQARKEFGEDELAGITLAVCAVNTWNRLAIAVRMRGAAEAELVGAV